MTSIPTVGVPDVADDATILDVREPNEWSAGHAPGAVHVPLAELPARLGDLPDVDGADPGRGVPLRWALVACGGLARPAGLRRVEPRRRDAGLVSRRQADGQRARLGADRPLSEDRPGSVRQLDGRHDAGE